MEKEKTNLQKLFDDFSNVFPQEVYKDRNGLPFGTYPFFCDNTHPRYEGHDAIIVGDDTEVYESENGKFCVLDYHDEENIVILEHAEVLQYYLGKNFAYAFDTFDEQSLAFRKGYKNVMKDVINLINVTDQEVKKFNPQNN